ncbi:MAG: hypothetical protein K8T90_02700 [Planctomycetes bacterium]|nr:hypothetical protein [Planctomycetota bacterium]
MAYELFLLPLMPGADLEEAGEALLALLEGAVETQAPSPPDAASAALVGALRNADPTFGPAPTRDNESESPAGSGPLKVPVVELRDSIGIEVSAARGFARFRVPFHHRGDDAHEVFDRLFRLVAVAAAATGWRAYDPQEAEAVSLDEAGCEATLEIYLTVMDQLRPSSPGDLPRTTGTR